MSGKIKIVADMHIPFLKGVLEDVADVIYLPWQEMTRERVHDADALITRTRTRCDRSLLQGSAVKMIAAASIGYDHIDTDYCEQNGIAWTNAPGCNSTSVEQYLLSALMFLRGKLNLELQDLTIGVVGAGYVGTKVARISNALGMNVLLNDPPRERKEGSGNFVDISRIRQESDILTFHVPLYHSGRDKTYHMVDDGFLQDLGRKTIVINTSRGSVIKGDSLKKALQENILSACVLDVWENEPEIDTGLLDLVDIGTPHIAGYSADGKANAASMSVHALSEYFGLDLGEWYPAKLPPAASEKLIVDGAEKSVQEIVSEVVHTTYDIMRDDGVLRDNPSDFEDLRADYPVRREAGAHHVRLINDAPGATPVIRELGYQVLADHCL